MPPEHETVIILDFGGQYTQLEARRVRELGVYSEILPHNASIEEIRKKQPSAIILSGGPSSVYEKDAPHCDRQVLELGVPVLGICYGFQLIALYRGGEVTPSNRREYGNAEVDVHSEGKLLAGLKSPPKAWRSQGENVAPPRSGLVVPATTERAIAAAEDTTRNLYGLQFHPEVAHTPQGKEVFKNFLEGVCHLRRDWTMKSFIDTAVADIRRRAGNAHVVCGLSGGVDSSVAAALVSRAIGGRQTCIFVDTGLLRKNEFEEALEAYREMDLNVVGVAAGERFLTRLAGVVDPERKRKIIGNELLRYSRNRPRSSGPSIF